jgi:hypothetical protein
VNPGDVLLIHEDEDALQDGVYVERISAAARVPERDLRAWHYRYFAVTNGKRRFMSIREFSDILEPSWLEPSPDGSLRKASAGFWTVADGPASGSGGSEMAPGRDYPDDPTFGPRTAANVDEEGQ